MIRLSQKLSFSFERIFLLELIELISSLFNVVATYKLEHLGLFLGLLFLLVDDKLIWFTDPKALAFIAAKFWDVKLKSDNPATSLKGEPRTDHGTFCVFALDSVVRLVFRIFVVIFIVVTVVAVVAVVPQLRLLILLWSLGLVGSLRASRGVRCMRNWRRSSFYSVYLAGGRRRGGAGGARWHEGSALTSTPAPKSEVIKNIQMLNGRRQTEEKEKKGDLRWSMLMRRGIHHSNYCCALHCCCCCQDNTFISFCSASFAPSSTSAWMASSCSCTLTEFDEILGEVCVRCKRKVCDSL